jgi:hypothetical protein
VTRSSMRGSLPEVPPVVGQRTMQGANRDAIVGPCVR